MRPIYLDWNASTPVHPDVREAVVAALDEFSANPSSAHEGGRRARRAVEEAREAVATLIDAQPAEIIFTGAGSEANNLALAGVLGLRPGHVVTSPIEHPSVLGCLDGLLGKERTSTLPVSAEGVIIAEEAERFFRPDTVLVSVMRAHNETGVLQPVRELARRARGRGILVHTDAVQAVGKIPVSVRDLEVDLLSLSAHKLRGPKGVGALYVREGVALAPLIRGGKHERGLRAGTENVPGIVGLARAAAIARRELAVNAVRMRELRELLESTVLGAMPEAVVHGARAERLPNTSCFTFPGIATSDLLAFLDRNGLAVSGGAACEAGSHEGSAVLRAMGVPAELARGMIRVSLGPTTNRGEIELAAGLIIDGVRAVCAQGVLFGEGEGAGREV